MNAEKIKKIIDNDEAYTKLEKETNEALVANDSVAINRCYFSWVDLGFKDGFLYCYNKSVEEKRKQI